MIRCLRIAALSAAAVTVVAVSHRAGAQDIAEIGRIHGTPLPASARAILA